MNDQSNSANAHSGSLLLIKDAARKVGYTTDYVGRLCREGKVAAVQHGRQWLVDVDSLKLFALETEATKRVRQRRLSEQRRAELVMKKSAEYQEQLLNRVRAPQPIIAIYSGLVMVAGCLLAIVFQTTTPWPYLDYQSAAAGFTVTETLVELPTQAILETPEQSTVMSPGSVVVFNTAATSGMVDLVRQQFSDEVHVTFETADSGMITPVFKNRSTTSYRFLMVPVSAGLE